MLPSLLIMGVVSIIVNLLWFGSLKLTTATNATMLMRTDLVFVVLLGALLGVERVTLGELALVPGFLAGMALLTGVADNGWSSHLLGDLMAIGATFFYAVNAFQIRTILREMDDEAVALYNHALSTLGFAAMAIACDDFSVARSAVSMASAWWWIAGVGVTAAVSLPLYYTGLRSMPVWKLRAWLLLSPVLVAIVEWFWGVRLSRSQCLGAAMVLGGLAALIRMEWRSAGRPIAPHRTAGTECSVEAPDCQSGRRSDPSNVAVILSAAKDLASNCDPRDPSLRSG
jgi:drug/metabolite transporter (DMT)-like permease